MGRCWWAGILYSPVASLVKYAVMAFLICSLACLMFMAEKLLCAYFRTVLPIISLNCIFGNAFYAQLHRLPVFRRVGIRRVCDEIVHPFRQRFRQRRAAGCQAFLSSSRLAKVLSLPVTTNRFPLSVSSFSASKTKIDHIGFAFLFFRLHPGLIFFRNGAVAIIQNCRHQLRITAFPHGFCHCLKVFGSESAFRGSSNAAAQDVSLPIRPA